MSVLRRLMIVIPKQHVLIQLEVMNVHVNQDIMEMGLNVLHVK